jgi:catechol 2,3-dioxygenase-like lactoylglutathione lyase family enzyme
VTASAAYTQIFGLAPEHASITDFKPPDLAGKLRDVDVTVGGARVNELSRGGKNNRVPLLIGVHHVTVPSSDPLAASDWYVRVFDFAALLIEERENEVTAVLLQHPCGARLLLRRAAEPLATLRGYPLFGLSVANHDELLRWVERLTTFDVEHSGVHQAHLGWAVTVTGPDLVQIQLHTDEGPSGEGE